MLSIALSYLVMIVALCVSGGFRSAISGTLEDMLGDIVVRSIDPSDTEGVKHCDAVIDRIRGIYGVESVRPVLYCSGILRHGDAVQGVLYKAFQDTLGQAFVKVPGALASALQVAEGDRMTGYFVSDRLSLRSFTLAGTFDMGAADLGDKGMIVQCSDAMLRRVLGYDENQVSALEVVVREDCKDASFLRNLALEISFALDELDYEDMGGLYASDVRSEFSMLFNWLDLIDVNVDILLLLMTVVAAFNMVSALLILLFQHIRTIGILKTMGMTSRDISRAFLFSSGRTVAFSMLAGNILALALCLLQDATHVVRLDPSNYFVSYVPVRIDFSYILCADILSFAAIMAVLMIPCLIISSIHPSKSVDYR